MKASEEINQDESRQLLFDLERYGRVCLTFSAYAEFQHSLSSG